MTSFKQWMANNATGMFLGQAFIMTTNSLPVLLSFHRSDAIADPNPSFRSEEDRDGYERFAVRRDRLRWTDTFITGEVIAHFNIL